MRRSEYLALAQISSDELKNLVKRNLALKNLFCHAEDTGVKPGAFNILTNLTSDNCRELRRQGFIEKVDHGWSEYSATYALATLFMIKLAKSGHGYRLARAVTELGMKSLFSKFGTDLADPKSRVLFGSISYSAGSPNEIVGGKIERLEVIACNVAMTMGEGNFLSAETRQYDSARLINASLTYHEFRKKAEENGITEAINFCPAW